jgi:ferredoxin
MRRGAATGPSATRNPPAVRATVPVDAPADPVEVPVDPVEVPVDVVVDDVVVRIGVDRDEFVLDAARRHGLVLPSMCRLGWCTRCAVRVLSGEVDQSASRRFYPADRDAGFALVCTGRVSGPTRLLAYQQDAFRAHRIAHGLPVPRG